VKGVVLEQEHRQQDVRQEQAPEAGRDGREQAVGRGKPRAVVSVDEPREPIGRGGREQVEAEDRPDHDVPRLDDAEVSDPEPVEPHVLDDQADPVQDAHDGQRALRERLERRRSDRR
jgi:hypothetical protein